MFPLLFPLVKAVTSIASAGGSLALGAAKTAVKAVSATGDAVEDGTVTDKKGKKWDADSPQGKTVAAAQAKEEEAPKDLFGGLDLAKVKSAIDDKGPMGPEEEGPKTVYKQMIKQLQNISSTLLRMEETLRMLLSIEYERIQGMVRQDRDTTLKKGDTDTDLTEKGRGILGRGKDMLGGAYGKLKGGLSGTFGKLLGLGALIIAFKKYPEEIKLALEKVLKYFSDVYSVFKEEGFGAALKKVVDDFQNIAYPKIKEVVFGLLDSVWETIKTIAMQWLFGASGDKRIQQESTTGLTAKKNISAMNIDPESIKDAGFTKQGTIQGSTLTDAAATELQSQLETQLKAMQEISAQSDGRIQWQGIDRDMSGWTNGDTLMTRYSVMDVMNSNPMIDGVPYDSWDILKTINLKKMGGITNQMTEDMQESITKILADKNILANKKLSLENETWEDQGWWSRNLKHAGNKEAFENRKARELLSIQADIEAQDLLLGKSGQMPILSNPSTSGVISAAGTTAAQTDLKVTGTNRWTPASGGTVNVTTVAPVDASTKLVSQETTNVSLLPTNGHPAAIQLANHLNLVNTGAYAKT